MRRLLTLGCGPVLLTAGLMASAQAPSFPAAYAIVGARIETGDGPAIERGTLVLRDGLIEAVGADVKSLADAEVIPGEGLVVYPGFIDALTTQGLRLPEPQAIQDAAPDYTADAPASMREANRKGIRPELRAIDHLALTDAALFPVRQQGLTAALIAPSGGYISGTSALVSLGGRPRREAVVRPGVALHFGFQSAAPGYPSSLMGALAHLRQTLLDAQRFTLLKAAFARGGARRPPSDDGLEALQPALAGGLPVAFDADTENEIRRALNLSDEFGLKPVIAGGVEAWKLAPLLAAKQVPVLLTLNPGEEPKAPARATPAPARPVEPAQPDEGDDEPDPVLAERRERWTERVDAPARLHAAGVRFAFGTRGSRTPAEFTQALRRAVSAGLPAPAALRALTVDAARLLGVDAQMGTLQTGKIANVVVFTGTFTDPKAKPKLIFIDSQKFDPDRPPAMSAPMPAAQR